MKTLLIATVLLCAGIIIGINLNLAPQLKPSNPSKDLEYSTNYKKTLKSIQVDLPKVRDHKTVEVPSDWSKVEVPDCGFEMHIPTDWYSSEKGSNCFDGYDDNVKGVCLKTKDFSGYSGLPSTSVEQGDIIEIACTPLYTDFDIEKLQAECIKNKVEDPDTNPNNACVILEMANGKWFERESGWYLMQQGDTLYSFLARSVSFTTTQMLSSIKFATN